MAENNRRGAWSLGDSPSPGITVETAAARNRAVFREITPFTRLLLSGSDHLGILHRLTTNDFLDLQRGEGLDAVFTDNRGRIVSWGGFTRLDDDNTLLVIPSSRGGRLVGWLDRFIFNEEISIQDLTSRTGAMEVIGPGSVPILSGIFPALRSADQPIPPHRLISTGSRKPWLLGLRCGRLPGIRLIGDPSHIGTLILEMRDAGAEQLSDGGFETIRVEEGLPALGTELTEDHNPWEAGLDGAIHLDKGCYLGQEVIARLNSYDKVKQRLVGLRIPAACRTEGSSRLFSRDGRKAGKTTSTAFSPILGSRIALAYVRNQFCAPGTELAFEDENGTSSLVTVSELPFPV